MTIRFEFRTGHERDGIVINGTVLSNYTFKDNNVLVVETELGLFELTPKDIKILDMRS